MIITTCIIFYERWGDCSRKIFFICFYFDDQLKNNMLILHYLVILLIVKYCKEILALYFFNGSKDERKRCFPKL